MAYVREFVVGQVKAILVNIFGGIVNCATIATGITKACKSINLKLPLVVRLEGEQLYLLAVLSIPVVCGVCACMHACVRERGCMCDQVHLRHLFSCLFAKLVKCSVPTLPG